nr:DMT family transporter [Rhodococcus sp. HNM0569]
MSLAAAFLFALAAFLQQRAARVAVESPATLNAASGVARLLRRLVRSRTWLSGWVTNLLGFGTQAAALNLGSVAVVQPFMSTQLLFALPLASAERRQWPSMRDWASAIAVCGGLALLLTSERAAPLTGQPLRPLVLLAAACAIGLIVILVAIGRVVPPHIASSLVAVGAGLCFAMSAVFMKMTIDDLVGRGVAATAVDWPGYALAVSTLSGLVLEQLAFASGALPSAVAAMSVTNPLASFVIGMMAFDVPAPTAPHELAAIAASGVLIVIGVTGLAHARSTEMVFAPTPPGEQSHERA